MKRIMLATTAALALTGTALAQSEAEETVVQVLEMNGYPASSVDLLTQGEIAMLYVTATSEDQTAVARVIAGFDLPSDEGSDVLRDSAAPSSVELAVRDVLAQNGYDANAIDMLSGNEIANIYIASTSGDAGTVEDAISSAFEASVASREGGLSNAAEQAVDRLMQAGYSSDEIDDVTASELLIIYGAMTTGDNTDVEGAISSVMES